MAAAIDGATGSCSNSSTLIGRRDVARCAVDGCWIAGRRKAEAAAGFTRLRLFGL